MAPESRESNFVMGLKNDAIEAWQSAEKRYRRRGNFGLALAAKLATQLAEAAPESKIGLLLDVGSLAAGPLLKGGSMIAARASGRLLKVLDATKMLVARVGRS